MPTELSIPAYVWKLFRELQSEDDSYDVNEFT